MVRVILLMAILGIARGNPTTDCGFWCRTPKNQVYCCDGGERYPPPAVHPGGCPPVRSECPSTRIGFQPPKVCPYDSACEYSSKCCYDVCLEHHVCKPSQNVPLSFPEEVGYV